MERVVDNSLKREDNVNGNNVSRQGELDAKEMSSLAVARPVAPEIKPAEGAIPPPPAKPKVILVDNYWILQSCTI